MAKKINATNYALLVDGELKNFSEPRWQSYVEKYQKDNPNEPAPSPAKVCTFVVGEAETPADFAELAPNPDVQVALFNRGASLKQLQEIRLLMEDPQWEAPGEGVYDVTGVINEVSERRSADPESKINKLLGDLPEDAVARIVEKLMARVGTTRT